MRFPKLFCLIFFVSSLSAQDSLPKTKLKLFDLNIAGTLTGKESSNLSMDYVKSFAGERYFLSERFTSGYSDTAIYNSYSRGRRRNRYRPPRESPGSVYGQIGFNMSFKFNDSKSNFIGRIKPRIGIYHSSRRFFSYNISKNEKYALDTLFFADPQYPPIIRDSLIFRNINYKYTSKQVYFEMGLNMDVYKTRFFILYAGVLYGYGLSYKNEFYVRQDDYFDGNPKPGATTEIKQKEPSSSSSRITVPIGVLFRFASGRKFSPGIYAECSPGYESYKIKGGRSLSHPICAFTWGFRFNFQKHK